MLCERKQLNIFFTDVESEAEIRIPVQMETYKHKQNYIFVWEVTCFEGSDLDKLIRKAFPDFDMKYTPWKVTRVDRNNTTQS